MRKNDPNSKEVRSPKCEGRIRNNPALPLRVFFGSPQFFVYFVVFFPTVSAARAIQNDVIFISPNFSVLTFLPALVVTPLRCVDLWLN